MVGDPDHVAHVPSLGRHALGILSFGYYLAVWGYLLALALCGAWFLVGMRGAKWVLRAAALTVTLYTVLFGLHTEGDAPIAVYVSLSAIVLFCMASIALAGRSAA